MDQQSPLKKPLILLGVVILIVIIGGIAYSIYQGRLSAKITTEMVPTEGSTIKINGKTVKEGELKVKPGAYTLEFSHPGFATYTKKVTIKKGDHSFVGAALEPNTKETLDWYIKNSADGKKAEGISSKTFDSIGEKQVETLPLIQKLPLVDNEYRIDYGASQAHPNDPDAVALYVTYYTDQGKLEAVAWIRSEGYDPAKLEIIYQQAPFEF